MESLKETMNDKALIPLAATLALGALLLAAFWLLQLTESTIEAPSTLPQFELPTQIPLPEGVTWPADALPHAEAVSEQWRLFGWFNDNLAFLFTLQRLRLADLAPEEGWRSDSLMRAEWLLHDSEQTHLERQRLSRVALGLAGSQPTQQWVESWQLHHHGEVRILIAQERDQRLVLRLEPEAPPWALLERGPLRLWTRAMRATGAWQPPNGAPLQQLEGRVWLEHAWGQPPTQGGQTAADSLLLDLPQGPLRLAVLHPRGEVRPHSSVQLQRPDQPPLRGTLAVQRRWQSPQGTEYPIAWALQMPEGTLQIEATLDTRERTLPFARQWSGGLTIRGQLNDQTIRAAQGWAELNGYTP